METQNADSVRVPDSEGHPFGRNRGGQPEEEVALIPISSIRDADSPRLDGESAEHVKLLAELDEELPPIVVHRATMRVVDGMHRLAAARLRGRDTIAVRFFRGSEEEAFVEAVRSNIAHGLPLTLADRRAAAARVLRAHAEWSDRMIAGMIGLSPKTVGAVRRSTEDIPRLTARIGRDGRVRGPRAPEPTAVSPPDDEAVDAEPPDEPDPLLVPRQRDAKPCSRADTAVPRKLTSEEFKRTYRLLCQDPSLRMSETGRFLLRLLDLHLVRVREWERLLETVPPHRVESVAHLAAECARTWLDFANRVARQGA